MKLATRAFSTLVLGAVPAALANPDLLNDQRVHDPAGQRSYFGAEMEGGTLVVGYFDFAPGGAPGLLVFDRDRDSGQWVESQAAITEAHGGAIDLEGGLLVVGDMGTGQVFVLERDANGEFVVSGPPLVDPDPPAGPGGNFGFAVSTDGVRIAVGRSSADYTLARAYVFERDAAGQWQPALVSQPAGLGDLAFARALAIQGGTLVVGATYLIDPALQPGEGAAFVYQRQVDGSWALDPIAPRLFDPQGESGDLFGSALDIDGGTLIVSGITSDKTGAVFVYQQDPVDGHFAAHPTSYRLLPPAGDIDTAQHSGFGASLSVQGDTIAVGSIRTNVTLGGLEGAAYLFERDGTGAWALSSLLPRVFATPVPDDKDDRFASKVDLDGDLLCATRELYGKTSVGSAHVFSGPYAATDLYPVSPQPGAAYTGLAVGSVPNLKSVLGPGGGVLLDWDLESTTPPVNDLIPPAFLGPGVTLELVTAPDPALLAPALPLYPQPFAWYPDGSFFLIPAAGISAVIELEYAWFLGELQMTEPARVLVVVGRGRTRGRGE